MSLKSDFYDGLTGLHSKLKEAFDAGMAFVGSGVQEVSSLDLGDRNGAALDQVGAVAGYYFDVSSPSTDYRVWMRVDTEVAPATGGRTLVEVVVGAGNTRAQVADAIADALNAVATTPFIAELVGDSIKITCSTAGSAMDIGIGTLGGTAVAYVITPGVAASGNYTSLQSELKNAASQGKVKFTVSVITNFNSSAIRANNSDNLLKKAYFAGIKQALADTDIFEYECELKLNVSDSSTTKVDFNFNFQTT